MTPNVGTPLYVAPEVLDGRRYSKKCDVYSWAIMMWEILTCKRPYYEFRRQDFRQLKMQGITPTPIRGLPDSLDALIKSSWAHNPSDRPTMARVVEVLKAEDISFHQQRSFLCFRQIKDV